MKRMRSFLIPTRIRKTFSQGNNFKTHQLNMIDCLDFMEIGYEIICFCYGSTTIIPYACCNFVTRI